MSEDKATNMVVKMTIPASVEQEIRDKRVGKDAADEVSSNAPVVAEVSNGGEIGKREAAAGGDVKLETDPSESGEPFVTKFGPAITTADVQIGLQV